MKEPSNKYAVAVRCSCHSVWCQKCFRKHFAPKQSMRMQRMNWRRVRMITLTLNPANWVDGEDAYMWYKLHKPVGRFIENLKRAGIVITDWTCNMEWHDNGFPHWHLLIEVDKPGKAGMIGQELLHKLWSWGDENHRIHEWFFKSEERFKKFTGYFAKTGYLQKDKQHQMILPSWANGQGWEGMKINRFSSMRRPGASQTSRPETSKKEPVKRPRRAMTYATKHSRCGNSVEIWEVEVFGEPYNPTFSRTRKGVFNVPYDVAIAHLEGEFYKGFGFSYEANTDFVCRVMRAWEVSPPKPPSKPREYQEPFPGTTINIMRDRHYHAAWGVLDKPVSPFADTLQNSLLTYV